MKTDVYQIVTDKIIQRLDQGVLPWKHYSTLRAEECAPRNLVSQRPYHGVNFFLLSMMGYRSPNWMTFRQAQELGGHVRKGEHSMPIVYWNFVERTDKETGEVNSVPFLEYFSVFNAEQVEGIDAQIPTAGTERETTANQEAELIVANMPNRPRIENGPFPVACYCPSSDTVQMTEQKLCVSDERYYEVLFHELIHSTGHKSRLDREKDMGGWQQFGSREYSKEELIAEMGAAFLSTECGISQATIDDSAAYIGSWIKHLRADPKLVVHAAGKAQKAVDWILNAHISD